MSGLVDEAVDDRCSRLRHMGCCTSAIAGQLAGFEADGRAVDCALDTDKLSQLSLQPMVLLHKALTVA